MALQCLGTFFFFLIKCIKVIDELMLKPHTTIHQDIHRSLTRPQAQTTSVKNLK